MTLITQTFDSVKGDEIILSGIVGKILTVKSLNVINQSGAWTFTLKLIRNNLETVLFSNVLDEGDYIEADTPWKLDGNSQFQIDATAGINLTIIAETND